MVVIVFGCSSSSIVFADDLPADEPALETGEMLGNLNLTQLDHLYEASVVRTGQKYLGKKEINENVFEDGKKLFSSINTTEYRDAMNAKWEDVTEYGKEYDDTLTWNLKSGGYKKCVAFMKNLSRIDGVYLYKIGRTEEGRDMLALDIDLPSKREKKLLMMTGTVHAREQAGYGFALKMISDMLNSKEGRQKLETMRIACVPLVNADVCEGLRKEPDEWMEGKYFYKANAIGIDLNSNCPTLTSGILKKGVKKSKYLEYEPCGSGYCGTLGEASETKAMMKWIYYYVACEQADLYIDLHQQGRIIYDGQETGGSDYMERCDRYISAVSKLLHYGVIRDDYDDERRIGTGKGLIEWAVNCAYCYYDSSIGNMVWMDDEGYTFTGLDYWNYDEALDNGFDPLVTNDHFADMTIEIGYGQPYLGGSKTAYKNNTKEYSSRHFDRLLYVIADELNKNIVIYE